MFGEDAERQLWKLKLKGGLDKVMWWDFGESRSAERDVPIRFLRKSVGRPRTKVTQGSLASGQYTQLLAF